MEKGRIPATSKIRTLRGSGVHFVERSYKYEDKEVAEAAARELGVDEHMVIKTRVMEDDRKVPFIVLMHGDKQVSTKALSRAMGVKSVKPCDPATAQRHMDYMVGGIAPFGTRRRLPVHTGGVCSISQSNIRKCGKRGLLMEVSPADLIKMLQPIAVRAARE